MRYIVWSLVLSFSLGATFAGAQERVQRIKVYDKRRVIYVSNEDGSDERVLTNGYDPSLSPDQKYVAFGKAELPQTGLWIINVESGKEKKIIDSPTFAEMIGTSIRALRQPRWSPDGKTIFFDWAGTTFIDLYVVNADGSNPQLVVQQGSLSAGSWPSALSPNSRKLLYNTCFDECYTLFVLDLDTGDRRQLSDRAEVGAWSPDGRHVAFGDAFGRAGLFVADIATGETVDLMDKAGIDHAVGRISWSNTGQQLAYTHIGESSQEVEVVYEVDLDGMGLKTRANHFPAWRYAEETASAIQVKSWGQIKKNQQL